MKRRLPILLLMALMVPFGSGCFCTQEVPSGYFARVLDPGGMRDGILAPGHHECWGRSEMRYIEGGEITKIEAMQIRCADNLNLSFELNITFGLKTDDESAMLKLWDLTPSVGLLEGGSVSTDTRKKNLITLEQVYSVYLDPIAAPRARAVARPYESLAVITNSEQIQQEIADQIREATKDMPIKIRTVTIGNLDPDDIVTDRARERARLQMEQENEQRRQQLAVLQARNALINAEKDYDVEVKRALAVRDANQIIAQSITPGFLHYEYIRALREAALSDRGSAFMIVPDTMRDTGQQFAFDPAEVQLTRELMDRLAEMESRLQSARAEMNAENVESGDQPQTNGQ